LTWPVYGDINIGVAKTPNACRSKRLKLHLTQERVAGLTGIAQSVISDLETGKNTNPTWDVLGRLAQVYNCRPEDLIPFPKLPRKNGGNH
jgi:transcriptional regulator with XRE-family HTH domain